MLPAGGWLDSPATGPLRLGGVPEWCVDTGELWQGWARLPPDPYAGESPSMLTSDEQAT
jgi:hypothetical protein